MLWSVLKDEEKILQINSHSPHATRSTVFIALEQQATMNYLKKTQQVKSTPIENPALFPSFARLSGEIFFCSCKLRKIINELLLKHLRNDGTLQCEHHPSVFSLFYLEFTLNFVLSDWRWGGGEECGGESHSKLLHTPAWFCIWKWTIQPGGSLLQQPCAKVNIQGF